MKVPMSIYYLFLFCTLFLFISCEKDSVGDKDAVNIQIESDISSSKISDHFFFVGNYGEQPSIYKFDLKDNSYNISWYSPKELVVKYLYSKKLKYAFFLTARKIGTSRGLSYIRGIKLYRLDPESSKVEQVSQIGDAIQIYVRWVGMNFNIQLTKFDLKIASHINKINQLYSPYGKLLKENIDYFDFINDRYPQFNIRNISLTSPSGNFGVVQSADSIFLTIAGDEQKIFIDSTSELIKKIRWSNNEDYVIFTVFKIENGKGKKGSSKIFVYYLRDQILKRVEGSMEKMNFIITDNLVIFENGSGHKSFLTIYNFETDEEIYRIYIKGGCGLSEIPGV